MLSVNIKFFNYFCFLITIILHFDHSQQNTYNLIIYRQFLNMHSVSDPKLIRSLNGHKESITSVTFHPGCRFAASGAVDGQLIVWDLYRLGGCRKLEGHKSQIHDVKFSPTGNLLASASKDGQLRLWDMSFEQNEDPPCVAKNTNSRIRALGFSCDGLLLATCGDDKLVKFWSTREKRQTVTLKGHKYWVRDCEFSPTSSNIASCDDKSVLIWDVQTKKQIQQYSSHNGVIHSIKFHKLGNCLASCSQDRTIKIYDLRSQKVIQNYEAHRASVVSIDFHPYSPFLISGSDDGQTKIWDLKKGCLGYILQTSSNESLFSVHGDYFLTGGSDKILNVWKSGFADSGRQNIKINEGIAQKPIQRVNVDNNHSENIQQFTYGERKVQQTLNAGKQLKYQIQKQNYQRPVNTEIGYDHPRQQFQLLEPLVEEAPKQYPIPPKLASKLSNIACQLDFITKTVQVLQARVQNNEEQLTSLKIMLE